MYIFLSPSDLLWVLYIPFLYLLLNRSLLKYGIFLLIKWFSCKTFFYFFFFYCKYYTGIHTQGGWKLDKERLGFHEEFLLIEFYRTFFEFLPFDMANQISLKYEQIDFPLISFVGLFFSTISRMKSIALRVLFSNKFNSR